jgi:hypothetical protein
MASMLHTVQVSNSRSASQLQKLAQQAAEMVACLCLHMAQPTHHTAQGHCQAAALQQQSPHQVALLLLLLLLLPCYLLDPSTQ